MEIPYPQKHRWQDSAVCSQTNPEVFFPGLGMTYSDARTFCGSCIVRSNCLEKAMAEEGAAYSGDRHGMFGGLTPRERYTLYLERNDSAEPKAETEP